MGVPTPAVAPVIFPASVFSTAMSSFTDFAGTDGCTARTYSPFASNVT